MYGVRRTAALLNAATRHTWARLSGGQAWCAVTVLLTFRCSSQCKYCDFPRHADGELETEEVVRLMRGLRRAGTVRLGLSGGEPLLREDLPIILDAAREQGFLVSLVTNGVKLRERLSWLDGVDYVLCTIEGDRATHDGIRGAGSYQLTVEGLRAARARGRARVGLICPVHGNNQDSIEAPLRLAEELQSRVYYQPVQRRRGWKGPQLEGELGPGEVEHAFRRILGFKASGRPVGNSERYLRLVCAGQLGEIGQRCSAGRFFVTVLPTGHVTPCCMLPFSGDLPRVDLDDPSRTPSVVPPTGCDGCTIAPYVENSLLLDLDLSAWKDVLRWKA